MFVVKGRESLATGSVCMPPQSICSCGLTWVLPQIFACLCHPTFRTFLSLDTESDSNRKVLKWVLLRLLAVQFIHSTHSRLVAWASERCEIFRFQSKCVTRVMWINFLGNMTLWGESLPTFRMIVYLSSVVSNQGLPAVHLYCCRP